MNSSDTSYIGCIVIAVIVGLIALAVYLIKKSSDDLKKSEIEFNKMLQGLPPDKQLLFAMQYNNTKKNPTAAVLLALFLGGLGAHKFYLGQTGLGVLYLLFCWTTIPSIIALIEAFTISGAVGRYNLKKATENYAMLGGANPAMVIR
jgi:TM2 domain-containing membrane protein YozV